MYFQINNKVLSFLFFLSIFFIAFPFVFYSGIAKITITEVLFFLTFLGWFYNAICTPNEKIELTSLFILMVIFLLSCLLSTFNAQGKLIALKKTFQFIYLFTIYYLIFQLVKENEGYISKIIIISIVAGLIVSAVGLYQYRFTNEPFDFRISESRLRAYATFGQPNAFGSYMVGLIPLAIGFYNFNKKKWWKIAILSCLFIFSLSLFATYSRGSWIGLVIGIGLILLISRKHVAKRSLLLPVFTILLAATCIFGDIYLSKPSLSKCLSSKAFYPKAFYRSSPDRQRFLLGKSAVAMIIDHPFIGVGPGNYRVVLPQYASKELMESAQIYYDPHKNEWFVNPAKKLDIELAHNIALQVAAEMGLIGLTIFSCLLYVYYKTSLKLLKQCKFPKNIKEYSSRAGLIGSFTAIMAAGLFGWPFCHGPQEILVLTMSLSTSPWGPDM
jgi:putative inorganic carbon (HCO3(-)) transporter